MLTAEQVNTTLTNAGCKVFIDAGNLPAAEHYTSPNPVLHVGGAMEDTSYGTYTFPKLKAAVLQ